jgi:hypothetical protein
VRQADLQRMQLALYHSRLEGPVAAAGVALGFLNSLRRSPPLLITGLAVLLLKTPWRRLSRIPRLAWRGWKMVQFVRGWARS